MTSQGESHGPRGHRARRQEAGRNRSGRAGRARRPRVDPARHAALDVLREVTERDAYANLILAEVLDHHGLDGRDAAFATELAYGALRLQGTHDAVLAHCTNDRPLSTVDADVLDVLRLGAHQILAMRVPDHAAVSATVDLAAATVGPGPAKFVNAVLRAVTRRTPEEWLEAVEQDALAAANEDARAEAGAGAQAPSAEDRRLGVRHAHPAWMVAAFRRALAADGREEGELEELLRADNDAPRVTLVARPGLVGRAALAEQVESATGRPATPGALSPFALTLPGGPPKHVTAVRSGKAAVQDEGSQVVALALASAPVQDDAGRWADLCAGPGGKSALLGALGARRVEGGELAQFRLDATEIAGHRTDLVRSSVRALPPGVVEVRRGDGREAGERRPATYDRVLVDAPCTGLGALRRRPESRWRKDEGMLEELVPLQRELLASALRAARVGGVVAYATCSPHLAETRDVLARVRADIAAEGITVEELDAPAIARAAAPTEEDVDPGSGPALQLWPHRHGTDAMFVALMRRTS